MDALARLFRSRLMPLWIALMALYSPRLALAADPAPDPTQTASVSLAALWDLVMVYGWTWGAMAIGFTLLRDLLRRNESTHWIAQGRVLAWVTAAVGIGITAVQAHFQGAPWAGVVITGVLAAFKLIDPNTITIGPAVKLADEPGSVFREMPATRRDRSPLLRSMALIALIMIPFISCAARQRVANGIGAFLDCEAAGLPQDTLADMTALASDEARHLISGTGEVDISRLKEDMAPLKTDLARCAMTGAIAALPAGGALRAPSGPTLAQAFAEAKTQLGWGRIKPVGGEVM